MEKSVLGRSKGAYPVAMKALSLRLFSSGDILFCTQSNNNRCGTNGLPIKERKCAFRRIPL